MTATLYHLHGALTDPLGQGHIPYPSMATAGLPACPMDQLVYPYKTYGIKHGMIKSAASDQAPAKFQLSNPVRFASFNLIRWLVLDTPRWAP